MVNLSIQFLAILSLAAGIVACSTQAAKDASEGVPTYMPQGHIYWAETVGQQGTTHEPLKIRLMKNAEDTCRKLGKQVVVIHESNSWMHPWGWVTPNYSVSLPMYQLQFRCSPVDEKPKQD